MDFFICLPILFGCTDRVRPEGDLTPRVCPRCHNVSVQSAKSRMWFELCFVPIVPMSSKHIWVCSICHWSTRVQQGGWEPTLPQYGGHHHPTGGQGQWQQPYAPPPGVGGGYMSPPPNSYQPQGQQPPKR